jgi:hypothetical protein
MKQPIECPLCEGHGQSLIECGGRFTRGRLWLASILSRLIRKITRQEHP